jgi:hypothetical protein
VARGHPSAEDLASHGCRMLPPDIRVTLLTRYEIFRAIDFYDPSGFDAHGWVIFIDLRN